MKKLTLIGLLAMLIVAGCGDAAQKPDPGTTWEFNNPDDTTTLGCTPEAEPIWTTTNQEPWYVPGRIVFSQNDGLFAMASSWYGPNQVARTHDGASFELPSSGQVSALDKSWDLVTRQDAQDGSYSVQRRSAGEQLLSIEPEREDAQLQAAELSASGRMLAAVTCSEGQQRLLRWSVDSGELVRGQDIGAAQEYCNSWNGIRPQLAFGPAERTLVIILRESGDLLHVDLNSGETNQARVELAEPDETVTRSFTTAVVDAHIGPSGQRMLLSTVDGRVELRRLPSFERLATYESSAHLLNEMTYAPRVQASPVAWAPDGRRFASLSPEGQVVVRNLDGEILQTLPSAVAEPSDTWGMEDSAVALGFSHDGTRLAVGHYFGAAMYACEGARFPRSGDSFDDDVSLSGPTRLNAEEGYEWNASVQGHAGSVSRFLVDGEEVPAREDGVYNARFYEPGTYELTVVYDNGRASGSASMTLVVE